jgi:CubicO group peptidase (beta-lactamase class C family)
MCVRIHAGMGGVSTALMILPEHDIAVAVLCNAAHALPHCVAGTKLVLYCTAPCSALLIAAKSCRVVILCRTPLARRVMVPI